MARPIRSFLLFLPLLWIFSGCAGDKFKRWQETEKKFYSGKYSSAVSDIRVLAGEAGAKDKLLYLMDAGIILHTMGDYRSSTLAFREADEMAENIRKSMSREALSFLLSDRQKSYTGESFERVLIKFYLAVNDLCLGDFESAKRYFRKLDFELKEMKYEDDKYKQNLAARFLDAVISEQLGEYNDARVQYRNILNMDPENTGARQSQYVLAVKEKDGSDMQKYRERAGDIPAFGTNMRPLSYSPRLGELLIFHQAGKAPVKRSRGPFLDDRVFVIALRGALEVAIRAQGAALSTTAVLAMMGTAENPIPVYKERDKEGALPVKILLNGKAAAMTSVMNDYRETALRNFNDNYSTLVARNVASIAVKIVLAAVAANELSKKAEKASEGNPLVSCLGRILIGAGTGKAVSATIQPDLRCWRLLPSNFQITRIFLEPGEYDLTVLFPAESTLRSSLPSRVRINSGKLTFVSFRSMKPGTE